MKAKLIFDLENQDDSLKLLRAMKSEDMIFAINDILQLRKKLERRFEYLGNTNNDVFDGIQEYSSEIGSILLKNGINIDELMPF